VFDPPNGYSVSPLMGPILSITFGLAVAKWGIVKRGLRNEFVGVIITFFVGVVFGLCAYPVYGAELRSEEMLSRGRGEIDLTLIHASN
jgi:uncharacterized membrane protein